LMISWSVGHKEKISNHTSSSDAGYGCGPVPRFDLLLGRLIGQDIGICLWIGQPERADRCLPR